jgi:hypothetical protein
MHPAGIFRSRHLCTRCTPLSNFKRPYTFAAADLADNFLKTTQARRTGPQLPDASRAYQHNGCTFGTKVPYEQSRLVTAGAGSDFQENIFIIIRILRQKQNGQLFSKASSSGFNSLISSRAKSTKS